MPKDKLLSTATVTKSSANGNIFILTLGSEKDIMLYKKKFKDLKTVLKAQV